MPQVVTLGDKLREKRSDWEMAITQNVVNYQHVSGIPFKVGP